jgi:hypothetical protein
MRKGRRNVARNRRVPDRPRRVFILGAGFSAECGAPVLTQFLRPEFLKLANQKDVAKVGEFIRVSFPKGASPNIEEVLSYIDHAIARKESFENFDLKALQEVRDATVNVIVEVLTGIQDRLDEDFGVEETDKPYRAMMAGPKRGRRIYETQIIGGLVAEMEKFGMIPSDPRPPPTARTQGWGETYEHLVRILRNEDTVITLNYDLFLDMAIASSDKFIGVGSEILHIDYGTDFHRISSEADIACDGPCTYVQRPEWHIGAPKVTLLKLHGSLNWAVCTSCKSLLMTDHTPLPRIGKYIKLLQSEPERVRYRLCCPRFTLETLIVPPTWTKDYDNINLSKIWLEAMNQLAVADEIIFLGYSFSESDIEMRYLFTRALRMRNGKPWKRVTVVNIGQSIEFERYERFFGTVRRVNKKASEFLRHMPLFTPEHKIPVSKI